VVGAISANDPVAKGSPVSVSAAFRDADTSATHTAVWNWGDGTSSSLGVVTESAGCGSASGSDGYSAAVAYSVHPQLTDSDVLSDQDDWLVVAGARAQYKGTGTINGQGSYKFLLTAIDGDINGGGGQDRFRIKIWYYDSNLQQDVVVYDNQIDSNTEGGLTEG